MHLKGVFQAIYTAGVVIPTPVSVCRYVSIIPDKFPLSELAALHRYNHRSLNVQKLIEIRFSYVPRNMTLARMIRVNKVPTTPALAVREMEENDVVQVAELFTRYMQRFDMVPEFTVDEVRHQFMSGRGRGEVGDGGEGRKEGQVTWTFVVEVNMAQTSSSQ